MDCKVIPSECVVTQHKFLVTDFHFQVRVRRDRGTKITRTKWWKLKVMLLRCLRIKLLQKDRETQVKMQIVCGMRCRLIFRM
jgi:hypothetical protein